MVFALIFRKILRCIQADFIEHYDVWDGEIPQAYDVFETEPEVADIPPFVDIVWADDLAIVVTHKSAEQMLERLKFAISRTFHHCLRHALIPNLKKGKTEVMLFLRGPGSRGLRGQFFNMEEPFMEIEDAPESLRRVVVSAGYKHLGSKLHLGKGCLPEIKARLGMASAVFRKHKRAVFQNRLLSLDRRKYLFSTMVLSIVRYNTGTWSCLNKAEEKYYVSRMLSMYRGLLRAEVPDPVLRFWNNNLVIAAVGLAHPLQLLHEARLSFVVSIFKSGPRILWSLAAAERSWLKSIREAKAWMHENLKGRGPDKFGSFWQPSYAQEAQMRPGSFKRWIRSAASHASLQFALVNHWTEWHHDFIQRLIQSGYQISFPWPQGRSIDDDAKGEACLGCRRVFNNRAAWSVHAFKVRRRVNDRRSLLHGTRCEVCMKEFGSAAKLQRHLNYMTSCAVQLRHAGWQFPVQPGINSGQQKTTRSFPIPVLNTEGPRREWDQPLNEEWHNGVDEVLSEALLDCAEEIPQGVAFEEAVQRFKNVLWTCTISFNEVIRTVEHFKEEVFPHWEDT